MKIDKHFNGIPENYKKEGYDSQCDPRTLMNSLKCADETSFADRESQRLAIMEKRSDVH